MYHRQPRMNLRTKDVHDPDYIVHGTKHLNVSGGGFGNLSYITMPIGARGCIRAQGVGDKISSSIMMDKIKKNPGVGRYQRCRAIERLSCVFHQT